MNSGFPENFDKIDARILFELQMDGRIQNNHLADRVGISPPPCLRRVRALFKRGFIIAVRAMLDESLLGYEVVFFVSLQLHSQQDKSLRDFEQSIDALPNVLQCWLLSGETDYLVRCAVPSFADMQALIARFAAMPNVRNVKSFLSLRTTKDAPLPLVSNSAPQNARGKRNR
jgi:DNA-binding Lrp family transcriptional regulator